MRGAYPCPLLNVAYRSGEPPRARGLPGAFGDACREAGRTPACAGPTSWQHRVGTWPSENPRVRGAYHGQPGVGVGKQGEPPRARGLPPPGLTPASSERRTPACAGPTPS